MRIQRTSPGIVHERQKSASVLVAKGKINTVMRKLRRHRYAISEQL